MPRAAPLALGLLLSIAAWAAESHDACAMPTSAPELRFELSLKDHGTVFQAGEIITLELSFSSTVKGRYTADVRNYDRSGRLGIEAYCVAPRVPDPLESYFKNGAFIGGGLGGQRQLDETPLTAEAELNEWRSLPPGHYSVYAVSSRVWRPPDAHEDTSYGRIGETVRSNTIEIEVGALNPEWQAEQLRSAVQTLAGKPSQEEARHAARVLRFLNSQASTQELAKLFWGLNQQQPVGFELMFGLYGSPFRQLAIDAMRAELAAPDHAITSEFLSTLTNLQVSAEPAWDLAAGTPDTEVPAFFVRRKEHMDAVTKAEVEAALASLPRKQGSARALTLNGLLASAEGTPEFRQRLRSSLVAVWSDLPEDVQRDMIQNRWPLIAGAEMAPILRKTLAAPPPGAPTLLSMARDATLKHLYELDAAAGREAILSDVLNPKAQPGLDVVSLLSAEDIAKALPAALKRIESYAARELDYQLADRYGDAEALPLMRAAYEKGAGKWACAIQSAMLRYFLRVAPEYGAAQVTASLAARKNTGCYRTLLSDLGTALPAMQPVAIDALDDADNMVVQDAAQALQRWGSKDAEKVLWDRLKRFHAEWAGREDELRRPPDYQSPAGKAAALEQVLVAAIAKGTNWICPPDKLARLSDLAWTKAQEQQIKGWSDLWRQGSATITTYWFPDDKPTFSVLQYDRLSEDQLCSKLAQFPTSMELRWQFWQAGQISPAVSMERQETVYERVRASAAAHGIVLGKAIQ